MASDISTRYKDAFRCSGRVVNGLNPMDATVIRALSSAVVVNKIGQQYAKPNFTDYRIAVSLSNGTPRTFHVPSPDELRLGNRVRIDGNRLTHY